MSNGYTLGSGGATIVTSSGATTLLFLNPPAAPSFDLVFRRFWIGQSNVATYVGNQRVQLTSQVTAFPTLLSATPAKLYNADSASVLTGGTAGAAGTCGANASAEGAGAKTLLWPDTFAPAAGWLLVLTPEEVIKMGSGSANGLGLSMASGVTTATLWTWGCSWNEL